MTVVKLYWVLATCYDLTDSQVKRDLESLLRAKQILVNRADLVLRALRVFDAGKADFADSLIERTASGAGSTETMTFNARTAKHAGMALIR